MRGSNRKRQPPASRKGPFDSHAAGVAHSDKIIENSIHDLFIEGGRIAKGGEVVFQGLRLHAFDGRNVFDHQLGKVWLAGHWTK